MDKREKVVLTFREKLGDMLMSIGIITLIVGALVNFSWFFISEADSSQINIVKPLIILAIVGVTLIRLSFYTIKKVKK